MYRKKRCLVCPRAKYKSKESFVCESRVYGWDNPFPPSVCTFKHDSHEVFIGKIVAETLQNEHRNPEKHQSK